MNVGKALIARARPLIHAARVREVLEGEASKGCCGSVSPVPVRLEPEFIPISEVLGGRVQEARVNVLPLGNEADSGWRRLRVWISSEEKFDWNRSESFLKQLSACSAPVSFELVGNRDGIEILVGLQGEDYSVVQSAFSGQFEHCRLLGVVSSMIDQPVDGSVSFCDYFPPPPYFHLLSSFEEFQTSPLESLVCALSEIGSESVGFYQCVFVPVDSRHNWHRNVEVLHDLEYRMSLESGAGFQSAYSQQVPSGDLKVLASELDRKAHNDKPFFSVALRVGLFGDQRHSAFHLPALSSCVRLFQHGGRPFCSVRESEYRSVASRESVAQMFSRGLVHRSGFLLNSRELCGLVHIFPSSLFEHRSVAMEFLQTLPVRNPLLREGTVIGFTSLGEQEEDVCIPQKIRTFGTHIMASSGMGKSTVMMNMFLQDIEEGQGGAFIDAHGDAVNHLMRVMPKECEQRCVYFNPGDCEWVPSWNPLYVPEGGSRYLMADEFLSALRRVSQHWGDRLGHVLRNGLIGLSFLEGATLKDLYNLVRTKSRESEAIRKRILESPVDDAVRAFWEYDFHKDYRASELAAPKHKLDPLVVGGSVSLMLSQKKSKIQFRRLMDEGKILLVDLSSLGAEAREVLGALILTLLMLATTSRGVIGDNARRLFSIFADEAHLFVATDAIENIIAQARKFGVCLCIAHQYLSQFKSGQKDALSTVGTTILGRLDKRDSDHFSKDLQDLVKPKDLVGLRPYEMIARIGADVVRFKTKPDREDQSEETRKRIIQRSHEDYCVRVSEASKSDPGPREKMSNRGVEREADFSQYDLSYDEF